MNLLELHKEKITNDIYSIQYYIELRERHTFSENFNIWKKEVCKYIYKNSNNLCKYRQRNLRLTLYRNDPEEKLTAAILRYNSPITEITIWSKDIEVQKKSMSDFKHWESIKNYYQYLLRRIKEYDEKEILPQEKAKKLGISVGALQAIMKKLKEFGFDINLSTSIESLADLKSATEAANDKLKELGKTEIDFNVNSTNIGNLIGQIDSASKILDTFKKEDGTVDLSVEGAQEAKTILAALIYQKQQVSEPAIIELNFNAETAKTEIESAALLVNDFRTKYRELEVKIATGEDTSTLQTEIQGIINKIDEVPDEIKTKLGLDSESFTTSVETLRL